MKARFWDKIGIFFYCIWLKTLGILGRNRTKKAELPEILVIKIDAIGDYILFRNFLRELSQSSKYKGYKITLVGNVLWRDLAVELDSLVVDRFVFIDPSRFFESFYLFCQSDALRSYDVVINYTYTRTFENDLIAFVINSKRKIAMLGARYGSIAKLRVLFFNSFYSLLVKIPPSISSEFNFNKYFLSYILGSSYSIDSIIKPFIRIQKNGFEPAFPNSQFIIIAPGAGDAKRQLNVSSYVKITRFLLNKYPICFVGSKNDNSIVDAILREISTTESNNEVYNLTGKTSLREMPYLIERSMAVICNDSGIYHIALAIGKPLVCFGGGGHFNRFVNYSNVEEVKICYHLMPCFNCNWNCKFKLKAGKAYPCIDNIDLKEFYDLFSRIEIFFKNYRN